MSAIQQMLLAEAASGLNPKVAPWVSSVVAAGGTVSGGRQTLISNLFNSLDSTSITPKLWRLSLHAGENTQSATIDIVNLAVATPTAGPTFTIDRGYTCSTTAYIDLGTPGASPYTLNAGCFGFAMRTNKAASGSVEMGSSNATNSFTSNVSVKWTDGNAYFALNDPNSDTGRVGPANTTGIYVNSRTTSTLSTLYKAGASIGTETFATTAVPNRNFVLGGSYDNVGAFSAGSPSEFSMSMIGGGFTATDVANFTTAIQTYLTAVGA